MILSFTEASEVLILWMQTTNTSYYNSIFVSLCLFFFLFFLCICLFVCVFVCLFVHFFTISSKKLGPTGLKKEKRKTKFGHSLLFSV